MRSHNPRSYIHLASEKVLKHLVDEDGICTHTSVALAAMLGLTEPTVYVVRVHLETCPTAGGYNLPYRAKGPLVLTDPDKNLTTLEATDIRMKPVVTAAVSVMRTQLRIRDRNNTGLTALAKEAYAVGRADIGVVLEAAAMDFQTTGVLHPMTEKALADLGVVL